MHIAGPLILWCGDPVRDRLITAQELLPLLAGLPTSRDAVFQSCKDAYLKAAMPAEPDGDRAKKAKTEKTAEKDNLTALKELTIGLCQLITTQSHLWAQFTLSVRQLSTNLCCIEAPPHCIRTVVSLSVPRFLRLAVASLILCYPIN